MTGNDFLKEKRESLGVSVQSISETCDMSPNIIYCYERGDRQISSIPVKKGIALFKLLDCDIEEFFDSFYPFRRELEAEYAEWKRKHPRIYDCKALKKRFTSRISKIKQRNNLTMYEFDRVYSAYRNCIEKQLAGLNVLTDEQYDEFILPLNSLIRQSLSELPDNKISQDVLLGIYGTDLSVGDVASLCHVTRQHLGACLDGRYDIEQIHLSLALRLCILLKLDFRKVFLSNINF